MSFSCKFSLYVGDIWNLELRKNDERLALDELDHQRTHAPKFGIFTHFYEHFEGHGPMASDKKKRGRTGQNGWSLAILDYPNENDIFRYTLMDDNHNRSWWTLLGSPLLECTSKDRPGELSELSRSPNSTWTWTMTTRDQPHFLGVQLEVPQCRVGQWLTMVNVV